LLHLLGIVLSMSRTRHQAGKPQAVKEIVHAGQRILDPEFLLENPLSVFGPQGAYSIGLGRLGQETLLERPFLRRRQVRGPSGLSLGSHGVEPVIPIHIHPPLYEGSAAAQSLCDGRSIATFQGQNNGTIAVSLLGIPLLATLLTQVRQILRLMELDLHLTIPPVFFESMSDARPWRYPIFTGAREFLLIRIIQSL
jgi:hypothetical protein